MQRSIATMRLWRLGVVALLLAPAVGRSDVRRSATDFLRTTPRLTRWTLCTEPGSRPALDALGEVLERNKLSRPLLGRVLSNPHMQPYLSRTLPALRQVDHLPGVDEVLERMAQARDGGSVRGPVFEVIASAALKDRLQRMATFVDGNEVDGVLRDGTIVEMKSTVGTRGDELLAKAGRQLERRCHGCRPGMIVLSWEPTPEQKGRLGELAVSLRTGLRVMTVDPETGQGREVFNAPPCLGRPGLCPLARGLNRLRPPPPRPR